MYSCWNGPWRACEGGTGCVRASGCECHYGLGRGERVGRCWRGVGFWCWLRLVLVGVANEDILGLFRRRGGSSGSGRPDVAGNGPGGVSTLKVNRIRLILPGRAF
jgi:hypothetical protein